MAGKVSIQIMDTSRDIPAANVKVTLRNQHFLLWEKVDKGYTDLNGRLLTLSPENIIPGRYRMNAHIGAWYQLQGIRSSYCGAMVDFFIGEDDTDFHFPLLISPSGWSSQLERREYPANRATRPR